MSRERFVTRTITSNIYDVICMDVVTVETIIKEFVITGDIPSDNEKAMRTLRKLNETDEFKLVAIQNVRTEEELFGISEIEFIKVAHRLDKETRKAIEE